jgi:two-component system, OmpR family, phosphate regulon sensor histidine kinase PhoR
MIRRLLELLSLTLAGGLLALRYSDASWVGVAGALTGAALWMVLENIRTARVLHWLRLGDAANAPDVSAVWGEVVDRTRKGYKAWNRKVRKSDARLQEFLAAIQASPNGVVLLNKAAVIEWSNFTAGQHLGFDPKRDLQQPVRNMVRDPVFIDYLNMGDFGKPIEIDGCDAHPSHPHRVSIQIHPYGKGRKLLMSRDVTAVQQAEAMRRDFVANVSHEIRTPLTVVSGFLETLMTLDVSKEEQHRYLMLMHQQADRMQTLVSDLLTLSRLEGSPVPGSSEWVKSQTLLDQVVGEARALSDVLAQGEHVITAEPGPQLEIAGARAELVSAMSNLLSNAVRYTPAGGDIKAGWHRLPDGSAEFYVTDSGPGIDAEHLPRLTERFYRVDRSRSRETGGTGLGLAIVKHVAQRHGGQVLVDSEVGRGSTFRIVLPPSRVLAD